MALICTMTSQRERPHSTVRIQAEVLKCSICIDTFSTPKVAGPCNHSFCRDCLHKYVTSLAVGKLQSSFPCPECRRYCPLPANGVNGLETNRLIVSLIEGQETVDEPNPTPDTTDRARAGLKHDLCGNCEEEGVTSNNASLMCAACDGTRLCDDCGRKHPDEPDTLNHEVASICGLHGKSLGRFCRTCGTPICIECSRTEHPKTDHDIKTYRAVIDEGKQDVQVQIEAARKEENALGARVLNLFPIKNIGDADLEKLMSEITEKMNKEWSRIPRRYQPRLIKVRDNILRNLGENLERQSDDIGVMCTEIADKQEELSREIERGESLINEKVVRSRLHEDMMRVTKQLAVLSVEAKRLRKEDTKERLAHIKEMPATKRREFAMSEIFLESAGMYSRASLSGCLEVPKRHVILGVTCLSGGRIAVCSGTRVSEGDMHHPPYALDIWSKDGTSPVPLMKGDDPLVDVCTDGKEEKIVVLCQRGPVLRVVDLVTKRSISVDVDIPERNKKWLVQVQVDYRGQFLVIFNHHQHEYVIMVILPDGTLSYEIPVGCDAENLTLCKLTGELVTCSVFNETITTQPWQGSNTEAVSAPHGKKGFQCSDICSGNLGEIFVVGLMKRGRNRDEIRAYQLDLDDDEKSILLHRVQVEDELEMTESCWPKCSMQDDCLVICYGGTIKLFSLAATN